MYEAKGNILKAVIDFIKKLVAMVKDILAKLNIELPTKAEG